GVEFAAVTGRDDDLHAVGVVLLAEVGVLLFGEGFDGREVDDALALEGGLDRRHFADEGFAGAGGGLDEEVAAVEEAVAFDGGLLQGEQGRAFAALPQGDYFRRNVELREIRHLHGRTLPWVNALRQIFLPLTAGP